MPIYEGQTVEEAISAGLAALGLTESQVTVEVLDEGKKGFLGMGKKNARVSLNPVLTEEVVETVEEIIEDVVEPELAESVVEVDVTVAPVEPEVPKDNTVLENLEDDEALMQLALYLTNISRELNAPALVKTTREHGTIVFQLETQKQGILIGKHGKTLNALQYLAQVFIHRVAKNKLSVVVNVGNYREKRQAILQRLAERTAEKVDRTGRPVFLEPMPAFERKQIHAALSKKDYVTTHSEGDEPYRYLVVEPAKKYF
ncbi:spoIIIJ-associated protein [Enterococcus sp. DIV2402]|uniref:RNA-binding protein KhpB n=1 Tax=Candidatus Enterococcus lowellii TaxID=2230877 RepID=A0ABZ2SJY5_9ENTE|nr:RNA-binding cell elongation regulator Jag/EloR [Enterococcus sp. DIV2402]MBO0465128.1 protein jag [Enterococcus sp. DIV2402]